VRVWRIFWIALFAAVIGVAIPGEIAWKNGTFYQNTFRENIVSKEQLKFPGQRTDQIKAFFDKQDADNKGPLCHRFVKSSKQAEQRLVAFDDGPLVPLWFWTFFVMGLLIYVYYPGAVSGFSWAMDSKPTPREVILLGVGIELFYEGISYWHTYFGIHDSTYPPHTVYYYNLVISLGAWVWEQVLNLTYSFLLAWFLLRWVGYVRAVRANYNFTPTDEKKFIDRLVDPELAQHLSGLYKEWLVISTLFASSYAFDTLFYWREVASDSSSVNVLQAVLEHTVWAAGWIVISLPVLHLWQHFRLVKSGALKELMKNDQLDEGSARLLDRVEPLNGWLVLVANIGAVLTFLLSLLHAVTGKG
jgi:hypothetical protein